MATREQTYDLACWVLEHWNFNTFAFVFNTLVAPKMPKKEFNFSDNKIMEGIFINYSEFLGDGGWRSQMAMPVAVTAIPRSEKTTTGQTFLLSIMKVELLLEQ